MGARPGPGDVSQRVPRGQADPAENPVEPPRFWLTVAPPGFKNEDASAYNGWSDAELAAAWQTPVGETYASPHAPDGYNAYTRLPDSAVDGLPAAVLNNPTP